MQTFLPYPEFSESARALDYRRLGKQRVEAKQIYNALTGQSKGWVNHPATKMWRGHEGALLLYGYIMCSEWIERGYKDSMRGWFRDLAWQSDSTELPEWLGDEALHLSHQSNLIRKDPDFYIVKFGLDVPPDLPYFWPEGVSV